MLVAAGTWAATTIDAAVTASSTLTNRWESRTEAIVPAFALARPNCRTLPRRVPAHPRCPDHRGTGPRPVRRSTRLGVMTSETEAQLPGVAERHQLRGLLET